MDKKICQMVTDRITAELEKGVIPWQRPWNNCGTGKGPCAISSDSVILAKSKAEALSGYGHIHSIHNIID